MPTPGTWAFNTVLRPGPLKLVDVGFGAMQAHGPPFHRSLRNSPIVGRDMRLEEKEQRIKAAHPFAVSIKGHVEPPCRMELEFGAGHSAVGKLGPDRPVVLLAAHNASPCAPAYSTRPSSRATSATAALATPVPSPVRSPGRPPVNTSAPGVKTGRATWKGNPYLGVDLWPNPIYVSEIKKLAVPKLTGAMAAAAAKVAKVPTFLWIDTLSKTRVMGSMLADIRAANKKGGKYAGQFVVYDLPDRDCAAAASNGEYSIANGGLAKYKNYINTIRKIVLAYSDVRIILVIEPDSLANMVTNLNVAKCANAKAAYMEGVNYALRQLNLPNVAMYLDAGHAGWLGWPANQGPAAQLFAKVYKDAGSPRSLRGLVTNVANFNGWDVAAAPPVAQGNAVYDEKQYIHALSPLLESYGWAGTRFITDQGRSGKQPTGQSAWGDWCNAKGTGFGIRPSARTGDGLLDAFVWVKPGGESDGTSDVAAARYDFHCGFADALQPAPEAGSWFQAYFVQLLQNASPSFM
ncbi:Exoglucanase 2 [Claviceps citrina]|nr:Exoglucanase 2 [Claviceps citrina]